MAIYICGIINLNLLSMEVFYYRLHSKKLNELARFYTDMFNGEEPLTTNCNGVHCMCKLPLNQWIEIFETDATHPIKNLELNAFRPDIIYDKLVRDNAKIISYDKKKKELIAEDPDGNILYINPQKLVGVGMPIVTDL